jgi:hypothetical protein
MVSNTGKQYNQGGHETFPKTLIPFKSNANSGSDEILPLWAPNHKYDMLMEWQKMVVMHAIHLSSAQARAALSH